MTARFDEKDAAARGYDRADWDAVDSPELDDDALAAARPFKQAFPEIAGRFERQERARSDNPKIEVVIPLDADLLDRLTADAPDWRTRVNAMLRKAMRI